MSTKIATFAAAVAILLTPTNSYAGFGQVLDTVLMRGDDVVVQYDNKLRGCSYLSDADHNDLQAYDDEFCGLGLNVQIEADIADFHLYRGQKVQMCSTTWAKNCSNFVMVREAGDLNGDNDINVIDLMLMHRTVMDYSTPGWPSNGTDKMAADMNGDGAINVIDILLLLEVFDADLY